MGVYLLLLKDVYKEESLGCDNGREVKTEEKGLGGFANSILQTRNNGEKIMISGIKVCLQRQ